MISENDDIWQLLGHRFKAHPWHGIEIGDKCPKQVRAFIEVTPSDTVKYEIDKQTGYIQVDRPQKFSNVFPALYGFIPRTYCGDAIARYCNEKTGRSDITGDGDPLDICVLTERNITHGDMILNAVPIGGFRMIDGGEADDKIIAVMKGDEIYREWRDISDCPETIVRRLEHYFLTYKDIPGQEAKKVEITATYGRDEARRVIEYSVDDYQQKFGSLESMIKARLMKALGLS